MHQFLCNQTIDVILLNFVKYHIIITVLPIVYLLVLIQFLSLGKNKLQLRKETMKPLLMRHVQASNGSFKVWANGSPYMHNPWHYHPECELTFIQEGKGTLYIGDRMIEYSANDLILLGT